MNYQNIFSNPRTLTIQTKYTSRYLPISHALQRTHFEEVEQKTYLGGQTLPHCFPSRTQALEAGQNLRTKHNASYFPKNIIKPHADIL